MKPSAASSSSASRTVSSGSGVSVYDEQQYTWKPGDSFAAISKQYYQNDAYANALQRYNQEHALATQRMNNTGTPTPGDRIFIPQARILEKRHPDVILKQSGSTAPPAAPAPSSAPGSAAPIPPATPSSATPSLPPAPVPSGVVPPPQQ